MLDVAIRDGTVVTPERVGRMDVGIRDGTIVRLASPGALGEDADRTVDATDRLVLPGFVDSHVHVNLSLGEYTTTDSFGDLTRAAAHGGTTTVVPFAIPRTDETPLDALDRRRREADGDAYVDYGFHGCLTDAMDATLNQVPSLVEAGATSLKAFMVYEGRLKLDDGELRAAMRRTAEAGGTMLVHAENDAVIERLVERETAQGPADYSVHSETHPPVSETAAMWTVAELAADTACPTMLVHASAAGTRAVVEHANEAETPLLAETCPHYLSLSSEVYDRSDGERYVCSPPVRTDRHRSTLWEMVEDGSIAVVNSDHCGFTTEQKARNRDDVTRMPQGLPGVETTASMLYTEGVEGGRIDLQRFVELSSTNVAKAFGLYPRKGTIAVGSDADVVVFDPEAEWTIDGGLHMATDYSPFEETTMAGRPETVLVRGAPALDGELVGSSDHGEYLVRDAESAAETYRTL